MSNNNKNKQPLTEPLLQEFNQTPYYEDKSTDEIIGFLHHPPSICKVSRILRDSNESFFTPQLVSIGPIHREDPKLKEFEWLKECYLRDLLDRCSTPKETIFEACLQKVNPKIPKIKESYDGMIKKYNDPDLATMMVTDGCFILAFCFSHERKKKLYFSNDMQNLRIAMDLMLLENQVPFAVLQALFDCLAPYIVKMEGPSTLSQLLDKDLAPYINVFHCWVEDQPSNVDPDDQDHVLGYLHKRYQLEVAEVQTLVDEEKAPEAPKLAEAPKHVDVEKAAKSLNPVDKFYSIVELDRSGINFKPLQEDESSMTIKFQSSHSACLPWFWKSTLLMPTLVIDDTTELILRNFIAYEQSFLKGRYYFTSYAHAMDMLIDSQEDIAKLVKSEVLVNTLGSNKEAANMINKICKNMFITEFCYKTEFIKMVEYYNRFWPKNIARLKRTYFSNPWSAIALFAAIILFSLSVFQTVYTLMGT